MGKDIEELKLEHEEERKKIDDEKYNEKFEKEVINFKKDDKSKIKRVDSKCKGY